MGNIEIRKVETKKDLNRFIEFNYELYKGNPYAVPDLAFDLRNVFNPKKNPGCT